MREAETVRDRIALAREEVGVTVAVTAVAVAAALGFALLFLQEPTAHDAVHNFRHAAGITCH